MKLLFFSDVHGSPDSLDLVQQQIDRLQPERLLVLGDLLYHGPRNPLRSDYAPKLVAQWFNDHAAQVSTVRGNCDSEVDQMMINFPILAEYAQIITPKHKFFLTHGHHLGPNNPPQLPPGWILASGHTHIPMLERNDAGLILFNPGSISLPKGGNPPSFGFYDGAKLQVLELETGKVMLEMAL